MTGVLIRGRQREFGNRPRAVTTAAEIGESGHKPRDAWSHQGRREAGRTVPRSIWRERAGPLATSWGCTTGLQPAGRRSPVPAVRPGRGPPLRGPGTLTPAAMSASTGTAAGSSPRPPGVPGGVGKAEPRTRRPCSGMRVTNTDDARRSAEVFL